MKDKEEMIELGGGNVISKVDYQNALEEYYKTHKTDGIAPLTYDGKVIGRVYIADVDIKQMVMEITTDEGKKIIDDIMHQSIGVSGRKMGNILEDVIVDDPRSFIEFSILNLKNIPDNSNIKEQK